MKASDALAAIRDLVEAAEAAGWDLTDNNTVLQAGRDGYEALRLEQMRHTRRAPSPPPVTPPEA